MLKILSFSVIWGNEVVLIMWSKKPVSISYKLSGDIDSAFKKVINPVDFIKMIA